MEKHVISSSVERKTIWLPSFITSFQSRCFKAMEKFPKNQKFKLILVPIEEEKKKED